MVKQTSGADSSSSDAAEPEVLAAEGVEVDEVAAAAVAAATAPAVEEAPVEGKRSRGRVRRKTGRKSQEELTARAAAESVWVREDLRRIGVVSVILVAALALSFIVFGVMDVLNLY